MKRTEFFKKSQKATVLTKCFVQNIQNPPDEIVVNYNGIKYYPKSVEVGYNENGEVVDLAHLRDLNSNSEIITKLGMVQNVE